MGYRKYADIKLTFPDDTVSMDDLQTLCYVFIKDLRCHIPTPLNYQWYQKKPYQYRELIQHFLYRMAKDIFEDIAEDKNNIVMFSHKFDGVEYGPIEWNNERGLSINTERDDDEYWHLMPMLYLPPRVLLRIVLKMIEMSENEIETKNKSVLDFDLNS